VNPEKHPAWTCGKKRTLDGKKWRGDAITTTTGEKWNNGAVVEVRGN